MVLINPVSKNQTFYIPNLFKRKLKTFVFVPFPVRNSRALSSSSKCSKSKCKTSKRWTRWRKAVTKITTVKTPMANQCNKNSSKSSTRPFRRTNTSRKTSSSQVSRTQV